MYNRYKYNQAVYNAISDISDQIWDFEIEDKSEVLRLALAQDTKKQPFHIGIITGPAPYIIFDRVTEQRIADLIPDLVNCIEIEDLDTGEHTLRLQYPMDALNAEALQAGQKIVTADADGYYQLFEIIDIDYGIGGTSDIDIMNVYCEHEFYELGSEPIASNAWVTATLPAQAIADVLTGTRWAAGTVEPNTLETTSYVDLNPLAALRFIRQTWGGELRFRVTISGAQITGRYVDLLNRRGAFTGQRFELRHNVAGVKIRIDKSGLVTALHGRALGDQVDLVTGEPIPINFKDVEWTIAGGDPADKPLGQDWVGDEAARTLYGKPDGSGNPTNNRHIFGMHDESAAKTPETLLMGTWIALQNRNRPKVTVEINNVIDLEKIIGFEHEKARLGDTVYCIVHKDNLSINLSADIIRIERNRKDPTQTRIILGDVIPTGDNTLRELREQMVAIDRRRRMLDRGRGNSTIVVASEDTSRMPWYANIIVPAGSLHAEEYIEQAMNLLPPSGGRVVLMEGEYVISSLINIAGNVILEGQGDSTVIRFISQEETAQAEYWGMGSMIENAFGYTGGKIQVKNLVLDGNDRNGGPDVETFGIRLKGCPCLIENVTVKDVAHMYDSYYVNIWYNKGNECILRNVNIINEEYGDGVGINVTDSQSVTIDSCNVVGCNEAIKVENSRNVIISNNVISSPYVAIDVADADHISIVNNQIRDCYVNGVSFLWGPVSRSSIVDNIIEEIGEDAIYLANSDDNIISGNVITGAGTRSDDSHNGITIFLSSRNNIQDNIIRFGQHVNKPKYGIAITDWVSEYNLVTNNDLMNSGKSGGFYDNGTYTETTAGNRV